MNKSVKYVSSAAKQMRYIPCVRQSSRLFLLGTLAAVALRLFFIFRFPAVTTDSFIYGDIAKNWLLHGVYGLSGPAEISPTFIRLPGYPAFLAGVFAIFGMEHYRAVLLIQMFIDIGTCFLIADITRRVASARAWKAAFLLAALCPFFANYAAAALTETLEIFFTALSMDLALMGLQAMPTRKLRPWLGCGLSVGAAILLRPDGGLLLIAIEGYLLWLALRTGGEMKRIASAASIVAALSLAPLVPWTLRNFRTFHHFQPLAPRYANQENEFVPQGFNRWVKTWIADYVSVEEIYWPMPGSPIDAQLLPSRAFDSQQQRAETSQLIDDYNAVLHITPELDRRFATLASERIRHAPLRNYVWLPFLRIADMWLRPRTEMLPCDSRWWEFNDEPKWSALAILMGAINLIYAGAALLGLTRMRSTRNFCLVLGFVVLRSIFLGTLENPEPRYTLESYFGVICLTSLLFICVRPSTQKLYTV